MNNDKEQVVRFADALSLLLSKGECVPEDRLQTCSALGQFDNAFTRYSRFHLQGIFQFMGCSVVQANDIIDLIFDKLWSRLPACDSQDVQDGCCGLVEHSEKEEGGVVLPAVTLSSSQFYDTITTAFSTCGFYPVDPLGDLIISCDVANRRSSCVIVLGGTSGCGKSTLASLLSARLGFTTVVSTDHIRSTLRSSVSREEDPLLWASTYHAGEVLQDLSPDVSYEQRILLGFERQSEIIVEQAQKVIERYQQRRQCIILEGVHMNVDLVIKLMQIYPNCIPFYIYISDPEVHRQRFATRGKNMSLDAADNKYVKYFNNIRLISDYICSKADPVLMPKVDNTVLERSLEVLHTTIFNCMRRYSRGDALFSVKDNKAEGIMTEFDNAMRQLSLANSH